VTTFSSELTVELIDSMGNDASIVAAMMVSTKGAMSQTFLGQDSTELQGKIDFLMKNRHGSPFEHGAMTFFVEAPIAVFREWHRHRIGVGYNEISGRYVKLEPRFYIPPPERPLIQTGKPGHYEFVLGTREQYDSAVSEIKAQCESAYETYEKLLGNQVAKEVARGVLPVYTYSSMYVTMNPRSLMAFLSLRTKDKNSMFPSFPMWEIEQCGQRLEEEFSKLYPATSASFRHHGSVCP